MVCFAIRRRRNLDRGGLKISERNVERKLDYFLTLPRGGVKNGNPDGRRIQVQLARRGQGLHPGREGGGCHQTPDPRGSSGYGCSRLCPDRLLRFSNGVIMGSGNHNKVLGDYACCMIKRNASKGDNEKITLLQLPDPRALIRQKPDRYLTRDIRAGGQESKVEVSINHRNDYDEFLHYIPKRTFSAIFQAHPSICICLMREPKDHNCLGDERNHFVAKR
jgi:hypothetical protein